MGIEMRMGIGKGGGVRVNQNVVDADESLQQIEGQKGWCEVM
jgi:hypothetical protein